MDKPEVKIPDTSPFTGTVINPNVDNWKCLLGDEGVSWDYEITVALGSDLR